VDEAFARPFVDALDVQCRVDGAGEVHEQRQLLDFRAEIAELPLQLPAGVQDLVSLDLEEVPCLAVTLVLEKPEAQGDTGKRQEQSHGQAHLPGDRLGSGQADGDRCADSRGQRRHPETTAERRVLPADSGDPRRVIAK
jgi:hypothetical protein